MEGERELVRMPTRLLVPKGSASEARSEDPPSFLLLRGSPRTEEALEPGEAPEEEAPAPRPWRVLSLASSWAMRCWRIWVLERALPLS